MDLLVLAGGAGSRFGGPKQFEPVDENENFIMDYSIFDAINVGFDKIVILTRKKYKDLIENTLKTRVNGKAKIEVVFQENDWLVEKYGIQREKPLGTGFAVLLTKDKIGENFCMINADDFYGRDAFKVAYDYLKTTDENSTNFALVGYKLKNTMSQKGAVKRGVCKQENGYVVEIVESKAEYVNGDIVVRELETNETLKVDGDVDVSMNMLCFTPKIFDYLEKEFEKFCELRENLENKEFLIPVILDKMSKENLATIKLLETSEKWIGMTYKEDKQDVVDGLKNLVSQNKYPKNLWKE